MTRRERATLALFRVYCSTARERSSWSGGPREPSVLDVIAGLVKR